MMKITDLTVAIIEPSQVQARLICTELQVLGISHIIQQSSGETGLVAIQASQPDLVISAMYLPDMTGAELVQTMRHDAALEAVPFMLVSSETSFAMLEPIRQAGAIAILPKPFELEDMKKALFSTLDFIEPDHDALSDILVDGLKTLVVDDSLMARKHIIRILNNIGISDITTAENGADAVQQIESSFFDLVVTDYNMPEMDGEKLTRFIRNHSSQRSVPVLMVTSEGDQSRLSAVQQAGISGICDKPFNPASVKKMIRKMLMA